MCLAHVHVRTQLLSHVWRWSRFLALQDQPNSAINATPFIRYLHSNADQIQCRTAAPATASAEFEPTGLIRSDLELPQLYKLDSDFPRAVNFRPPSDGDKYPHNTYTTATPLEIWQLLPIRAQMAHLYVRPLLDILAPLLPDQWLISTTMSRDAGHRQPPETRGRRRGPTARGPQHGAG